MAPIESRATCLLTPENIAAVSVVVTPQDLRDIDDAASQIHVHGARYPEKLEQMTSR